LILFSMWRHQLRVANNQLIWQTRTMTKGKLNEKIISAMLSDGKISAEEHKILSKHISPKQLSKLDQAFHRKFISWLKEYWHKGVGKNILIIGLTVVVGTTVYFAVTKLLNNKKTTESNSITESLGIETPLAKPELSVVIPSEVDAITEAATNEVQVEAVKPETTTLTLLKVLATPSGKLNVREDPSTEANILSKINSGETVAYTDQIQVSTSDEYKWYKVKLPDETVGWVYGEYIELLQE
jgi:hypothetical protein